MLVCLWYYKLYVGTNKFIAIFKLEPLLLVAKNVEGPYKVADLGSYKDTTIVAAPMTFYKATRSENLRQKIWGKVWHMCLKNSRKIVETRMRQMDTYKVTQPKFREKFDLRGGSNDAYKAT